MKNKGPRTVPKEGEEEWFKARRLKARKKLKIQKRSRRANR